MVEVVGERDRRVITLPRKNVEILAAQPPAAPQTTPQKPAEPKQVTPDPVDPTPAPGAGAPTVSADRQAKIDKLVAGKSNATHEEWNFLWLGKHTDQDGGKNIARALKGEDGDLGPLTSAERDNLARKAVQSWKSSDNYDAWKDAYQGLDGNPEAKQALARAAINEVGGDELASVARRETSKDAKRPSVASAIIHDVAQDDPAATIRAFRGAETRLGVIAATWDSKDQAPLLGAIADGKVDLVAAKPLVDAMVVQAHAGNGMRNHDWYRNLDRALAAVNNPGDSPSDKIRRDAAMQRMENLLQGGNALSYAVLDSSKYPPALRLGLATRAATDPAFTMKSTADGWESKVVSEWMAKNATDLYRQRGTGTEPLSGQALRNAIGQSLGIKPDNLPADGDTSWMQKGADYQFYKDNEAIDQVARALIAANGGKEPVNLQIVPVTVTRGTEGAMVVPVFRIAAEGGSKVVDHQGSQYGSVAEWEAKNDLPSGKMTYVEGLDLANATLKHGNTPDTSDTPWEHIRDVGNFIAGAAGIAALGVLVVGTGGTLGAALLAGGIAAGGWQATMVGMEMADRAGKGHDVFDLSDPTSRGQWLELVASGATAIGGAGALTKGGQMSASAARLIAGATVLGNSADVVAGANQAVGLTRNWDRMSNGERAAGVLSVAFWGGLTVAGAKAGGGKFSDGFSFTRTANLMQHGTPYAVLPNADMGDRVRIWHDTVNRRLVLEAGPNASREELMFHSAVAADMERTMSLRSRLYRLLGSDEPRPGTAAWEARFELQKIEAERDGLYERVSDPASSPIERAGALARMEELNSAQAYQERRISEGENDPAGFVNRPSTGQQLAEKGGLDMDRLVADYNRGLPPDQQIRAEDYRFVRAPNNEERVVDLMGRDTLTAADVAPELRIARSDGLDVVKVELTADGRLIKADASRPPRGGHDVFQLQKLANDAWNKSSAADPQQRAQEAIAAVRAGAKPPITSAESNDGTVAVVIGKDGKPHVGLNSYNFDHADLALQRRIAADLGYPTTGVRRREMVFHAEANSLMNAAAAGQIDPAQPVTIYTDRSPCGSCRQDFGKIASYYGISDLTVVGPKGETFKLVDGSLKPI